MADLSLHAKQKALYQKAAGIKHESPPEKYVNIPSEKYIYVHIYVCICVYTYLCKMDERRSYASLSKKWMRTGIVLACHKNGWVPVLCWLVKKMDEYRYYAGLS